MTIPFPRAECGKRQPTRQGSRSRRRDISAIPAPATNRLAQYVILSRARPRIPITTSPAASAPGMTTTATPRLSGGAAASNVRRHRLHQHALHHGCRARAAALISSIPARRAHSTVSPSWRVTSMPRRTSDQNPAGGWINFTGSSSGGQENGDECAWIFERLSASANVTTGQRLIRDAEHLVQRHQPV